MPEHATLDTVLAEAMYALNKAITDFSTDSATHRLLTDVRDLVWGVRKDYNPALRD